MPVNMKLEIKGHIAVTFQGSKFHSPGYFEWHSKTKLALLAFWYCEDFVKSSHVISTTVVLSVMARRGGGYYIYFPSGIVGN